VGDGGALAETILKLTADPATCRSLAQRARKGFDAEFDKSITTTRWDDLLRELSGKPAFSAHGEPDATVAPASLSARNA
jgi:hypothetical protein